jgi:hypothetical protein
MTYYFPLGRPSVIPIDIDYSVLTTTASSATNVNIPAQTSSYAVSVENIPATGPAGVNQDISLCPPAPLGPRGPQGATGPAGNSLTVCPPNTKECTATTGAPADFPLVCIEIPEGCTSAGTPCPDTVDGFVTTTTTTTTTTVPVTTTTTTTTTTLDT